MKVKEIIPWLRQSKFVSFFRDNSKKIILPGFEGMSLYEFVKFTIEAFLRSDIATKSASISFQFFLALFPTLILLVSLIPYVPIDNFQETILSSVFSLLPKSANSFLDQTLEDLILRKHTAVLSVGFVLTIYYASNIINATLTTFSSSYQIQAKRNPIKQRLISFGLMLVITSLMLIGFALVMFGESYLSMIIQDWSTIGVFAYFLIQVFKWIAIVSLFIISISTLYNVAFMERRKWKIMSSGASLSTVGIIVASLALSYFINNFGSYNKLYGSIGSLIVFLLWIKVSSTILIVGFELYAKTNNKHDAISE